MQHGATLQHRAAAGWICYKAERHEERLTKKCETFVSLKFTRKRTLRASYVSQFLFLPLFLCLSIYICSLSCRCCCYFPSFAFCIFNLYSCLLFLLHPFLPLLRNCVWVPNAWGNQQRMQDVARRTAGGWAVSSCFVAQAATFVVIVIKIMLECFVSLAAIAALPRAAPVCLWVCI